MRIRARSAGLGEHELTAIFTADWQESHGFPLLLVDGDLTMSLEAALQNYDVIDATLEERQLLQRWGHPFGGVQ